ncbi:WhiB family transcriptional regulator [Dactylosporangium sp. AC04546]|uniref:WhiB family transcriptional regulator n=1 Tax=Dactylosporangium sp. AC04546 TaxID=2862460 RepID=UPI003FA46CAD
MSAVPSAHVSIVMSPTAVAARTDWWAHAPCAGADPDWWSESRDGWNRAIRHCIVCPVRRQCLEDAIASGDVGVIRGATWFACGRGREMTSLICARCEARTVQFSRKTISRYCLPCTWAERTRQAP